MCRSSSIPCRLGVQQLTTMAINRPLSGYGTRNIVPQSAVCDTKQTALGRSPSATTRYLSYSGVERITSFSLTGLHVSSARCNSHFLGLCSSMFTPFNCTRAQACTPTHSFFFFFFLRNGDRRCSEDTLFCGVFSLVCDLWLRFVAD